MAVAATVGGLVPLVAGFRDLSPDHLPQLGERLDTPSPLPPEVTDRPIGGLEIASVLNTTCVPCLYRRAGRITPMQWLGLFLIAYTKTRREVFKTRGERGIDSKVEGV